MVVHAYPLKIKAIPESLLLKPVNATTADTLLKVEKILFFTDFFTKHLNYLLLMKTKFAQMEETQLTDYLLNDELLSVKDIESALKLGHTKTYELIKAGEIETFTIGSRRMTTPALLRKFIDGKIREQAAQPSW